MSLNRSPVSRFAALLTATTMGVYLLLLAGLTTAVTDATAACMAWPACGGGWSLPTAAAGWIALGHRVTAVLVGLGVVATAVTALRQELSYRVYLALGLGAVVYPFQSLLGIAVATGVDPVSLRWVGTLGPTGLHLVGGLVIFGGYLTALGWTLESETGDPDESPTGAAAGAPIATGADSAPRSATNPGREAASLRSTVWAYVRLTKPRLMWLLCLVASASMALAGGAGFTPSTVAATLGGGALAIGASGTFNHILERDVDRQMNRTSDRPLAVDRVSVRNATVFGSLLAVVSLGLFASVNSLTAVLGLVAILFYSVIYTLVLKPNTVQNTVIGGAAGALPALIGWAAVTGRLGLGGIGLALLVFLWTPAHFYNLALAYREDYKRAGFPMLPVVRGETTTRRHVLWYLGATLATTAALLTMTSLDWLYALTGVSVGSVFLWAVVRLHYEQDERAALRAFHASNAYLGAVLVAVLIDAQAV